MKPMTMSRLSTATVYPVLPAEDLDRAASFYGDTLGLEVGPQDPTMRGMYVYAGNGSRIFMYERGRAAAENTAATFVVDDLQATMDDLRDRGVRFEDYDLPYLKTSNGMAESESAWAAWFTDSEGNIVNLTQMK
jgi:predicted enzyme related to lactoylglutathione lyase